MNIEETSAALSTHGHMITPHTAPTIDPVITHPRRQCFILKPTSAYKSPQINCLPLEPPVSERPLGSKAFPCFSDDPMLHHISMEVNKTYSPPNHTHSEVDRFDGHLQGSSFDVVPQPNQCEKVPTEIPPLIKHPSPPPSPFSPSPKPLCIVTEEPDSAVGYQIKNVKENEIPVESEIVLLHSDDLLSVEDDCVVDENVLNQLPFADFCSLSQEQIADSSQLSSNSPMSSSCNSSNNNNSNNNSSDAQTDDSSVSSLKVSIPLSLASPSPSLIVSLPIEAWHNRTLNNKKCYCKIENVAESPSHSDDRLSDEEALQGLESVSIVLLLANF